MRVAIVVLIILIPVAGVCQTGNTNASQGPPSVSDPLNSVVQSGEGLVNGINNVPNVVNPDGQSQINPNNANGYTYPDGQSFQPTTGGMPPPDGSGMLLQKIRKIPTTVKVPTSNNQSGGNLGNPNSGTPIGQPPSNPQQYHYPSFYITPENVSPSPVRATTPVVLAPLYRYLPFTAIYSPQLLPAPPDCNPQLGLSALVVDHLDAAVSRVMTCTGTITAMIPVATRPLQIVLAPDGLTALVTSFDNAISIIDTTANKVIATVNTDTTVNPSGIAITPDGALAFVTSFNVINPGLVVVDVVQRKVIDMISLPQYPHSVFLTPDATKAFVTFPFQNQVYVIDTLSRTVDRVISIAQPYAVAFNATATRAYVTSGTTPGNVVVLDTTNGDLIRSIPVGDGPVDIVITPDDSVAFVANFGGNSISVIDLAANLVQTVPVSGAPRALMYVQ